MRRPPALACLLIAAGCATVVPPISREETPTQAQERREKAPRPAYNLAGYPPAVREGYIDGCESARKSEYGRKDEKRFAADPQYRMGWNDGLSICTKK